jgi:Protein of unknown function (DUF3160)
MSKRQIRQLSALLGAILAPWSSSVSAAGIDDSTQPLNMQMMQMQMQMKSPQKPVQLQPKQPTLENLIARIPLPAAMLQPIGLKGVNITGLYPKNVETLGFTYFAVVDNTKTTRMSDIYRDCRLAGKSNFVTADSITHPYLAFANRILAEAVETRMLPDLRMLIEAMEKVALNDRKQSIDTEVRRDLECNLAYLAVAHGLLDEKATPPAVGEVPALVRQELSAILAGKTAPSAVFDGDQDYSVFVPMGWYNSSPNLQRFYRCREWLSLVPFAVSESNSSIKYGNMFRRSVLLFHCLDQANILGQPALNTWARLNRGYTMLGSTLEGIGQRSLYPDDYKLVFRENAADLKVTLQSLTEPFFRTKLMLALRNRKANGLSSASIFEMSEQESTSVATVFRLFPMYGSPELPWLRGVARLYPTDRTQTETWPLGLLDQYAWGGPQAGNILSDNLDVLDKRIVQVLPPLQRCVMRRSAAGQLEPIDNREWSILSQYLRPTPDGLPPALRNDLWYSQRCLSAIGGWVDGQTALAPPLEPAPPAAVSKSTAPQAAAAPNTSDNAGGTKPPESAAVNNNTSESIAPYNPQAEAAGRPRRVSNRPPYHYLEPNVDVFRQLDNDASRLETELTAVNYFPEKYKAKLAEFRRLFQRLLKIAETERKCEAISVVDRRLLADIDLVLDKVDVPLPAVLSFDGGKMDIPGTDITRGFNMAVGRPGLLYVILQDLKTAEWSVCRGPVYTYYETPAPLMSQTMWQHKIEAGFATPPSWTSRFEFVQHPVAEKTKMFKMD